MDKDRIEAIREQWVTTDQVGYVEACYRDGGQEGGVTYQQATYADDTVRELLAALECAQAQNAALMAAGRELVDSGPPSNDNLSIWTCCGVDWGKDHAEDCCYMVMKSLVEQARATLEAQP